MTTAALDLDWQAIRTLAIAIGLRPAIRQMGLEAHDNAVMQRSAREGWFRDLPRSTPLPPTMVKRVSTVSTAPQAMADSMRNEAIEGRASALRITTRGLKRVERLDDDEIILPETVQVIHGLVKSASIAGGYGAQTSVHITALAYGERGATEPDGDLVMDVTPESTEVQTLDTFDVPQTDMGHSASCEPPDSGVSH